MSGPAAAQREAGEIRITSSRALDAGPAVRATAVAELRREEDALHLTLDEVIALAMENNVELMVERYRHRGALLGILQSRGIFDLQLDGNLGYSEDTSPTSSTLQDAELLVSESQQADLTLSQLSTLGGTAQLRFNTGRSESSDRRIDPNPVFNVRADLSYTQPLLRDFGRRATRRNLIVARRDAAVSREDFQNQVEATLEQVTDAYWNLVEQREQLGVAEETLRLAEEVHEFNRLKLEAGILRPIERVQSEATVAARRVDIIQRRAQVGNAADQLRRMIHLETGEAWNLEIVPVFDPEVAHRPVELEAAISAALSRRPDLKRERHRLEILELDARLARNRKLPRLDVSASFGLNAREGDRFLRDVAGVPILDDNGEFIVVPGGFDEALSQLAGGEFNGWNVNLRFGYPLQNREARAASTAARLAWEQGQLGLRSLELEVRAEVRRNVREIEAAALGIESARIARELAEKNLEAVRLGYEHGAMNTLDLNNVQEDLSQRRRDEISAILNYRRTETAFYRSIGELLDRHGIFLADDEAPSRGDD